MLTDIWNSVRALPTWVKIWMLFLGPLNALTILFLDQPNGPLIAFLAYAGMFFLGVLAIFQRGLSKAGSIPHVIFWTPLVGFIIGWFISGGPAAEPYRTFLIILLITNLISLAFDYVDTFKWLRGDREILRSKETS